MHWTGARPHCGGEAAIAKLRVRHRNPVAMWHARDSSSATPRRVRFLHPWYRENPSRRCLVVRVVGRTWCALATAMLAVASACQEPQDPGSQVHALLTDGGSLAVDVNTTFAFPDVSSASSIPPGGFTVWVDNSTSQPVPPNGVVTFNGLAAGDHEVALYGVPSNCAVSTPSKGANDPQGATLLAGIAGASNFSLACGSWGGLFVSVSTSGVDPDADGYTVTVDGSQSQQVGANDNVTFTLLYAANHTVALSGVAANCSVNGSPTQAFTVSVGQTAQMSFAATCTPLSAGSGTLTVTTTT